MASLLCHLHFWSLKALSPGTASGSDIGTHVYHEKTAVGTSEGLLNTARREWAAGRGITWVPRNKKPEKLRDTLRECEELLFTHQPVTMKWKSLRHCLVLLDNGTLIAYTLSKHSGDVEKIFLDKSLISRVAAKVDNALLVGGSMVLSTYRDKHLLHVSLSQKRVSSSSHNPLTLTHSDSGRKLEKLSAQDPKIVTVEVAGLPSGQVQRHLVCNVKGDLVVIWWKDMQEGGWTWSSMADGRAENLLTFSHTGNKLQFCNGLQTDHDPISMAFSKSGYILYSLEKTGPTEYAPCTYAFSDKVMAKVSTGTAFSSSSNVTVSARNKNESLLLVGCENGSMILYDSASPKGQVNKTRALISPISMIKWHSAGALAFVCSPKGEVQCYDIGLNCLLFQPLAEDPSPSALLNMSQYFLAPVHLQDAGWGSEQSKGAGHDGCYDNFMMVFARGPLALLRLELGVLSRGNLGPVEVVAEYVHLKKFDEGISVLEHLDWNFQQNDCFACLTVILNHLLLQPLTQQTQDQMDKALATFFSPAKATPTPPHILSKYKPHVVHLQRRYFHLLYRHGKLERAYELAKIIQAKDLFMDIHFLALDLKEAEIAEQAHQHAEDLFSEEAVDYSMPWFGLEGTTHPLSIPSHQSAKLHPSSPSHHLHYSQQALTTTTTTATSSSGSGSISSRGGGGGGGGVGTLSSEEDIKQALHASSTLSLEAAGPMLHASAAATAAAATSAFDPVPHTFSSTLSLEGSIFSSFSPSPLPDQAIPFHSDHSATPSNSELEDYSDNERTQEEAT